MSFSVRFQGVSLSPERPVQNHGSEQSPRYLVTLDLDGEDAAKMGTPQVRFYSSPTTPKFMVDTYQGGFRDVDTQDRAQNCLEVARKVPDTGIRENLIQGLQAIARRLGFTLR